VESTALYTRVFPHGTNCRGVAAQVWEYTVWEQTLKKQFLSLYYRLKG
jgi:hypothetical protein